MLDRQIWNRPILKNDMITCLLLSAINLIRSHIFFGDIIKTWKSFVWDILLFSCVFRLTSSFNFVSLALDKKMSPGIFFRERSATVLRYI